MVEEQRASAMGDVARIQISGQVLASLLAKKYPQNDDHWSTHCENSIHAADHLVSHWEELIQKKIDAHQAKLAGIEPEDEAPEGTTAEDFLNNTNLADESVQ